MNRDPIAKRSAWRIIIAVSVLTLATFLGYWFWSPGLDIRDGRHDRGQNAVWLAHGWLGGDGWFVHYGKTNELDRYRNPIRIRELAAELRRYHSGGPGLEKSSRMAMGSQVDHEAR